MCVYFKQATVNNIFKKFVNIWDNMGTISMSSMRRHVVAGPVHLGSPSWATDLGRCFTICIVFGKFKK